MKIFTKKRSDFKGFCTGLSIYVENAAAIKKNLFSLIEVIDDEFQCEAIQCLTVIGRNNQNFLIIK